MMAVDHISKPLRISWLLRIQRCPGRSLFSKSLYLLGRDKKMTTTTPKQATAGMSSGHNQGTPVDTKSKGGGVYLRTAAEGGLSKALGICSLLLDISFPWFFQIPLKCQSSKKPSQSLGENDCTCITAICTHFCGGGAI